jgi:hypothetical protein
MLEELREQLAAHLRETPFFAAHPGIPLYTEKQKSIETTLQKAMQSVGLSAMVLTVSARTASNNQPSRRMQDVAVTVSCVEAPLTNKTGVSASALAEAVGYYGSRFEPWPGMGALQLKEIVLGDHPTLLCYHVVFSIAAELKAPVLSAP